MNALEQFKPDAPELIDLMLRHGATASVVDNELKRTLLICAAESRRPATVEWLLQHGADINARDKNGKTALMYAYTSPATIRLLIKHGADVETRDQTRETALIVASYKVFCDPATVPSLISEGARVNDQDQRGHTALWWTILNGNVHKKVIIQELLKYGADPILPSKNNDTPLKLAEAFHHADLVVLMRKYSKHP